MKQKWLKCLIFGKSHHKPCSFFLWVLIWVQLIFLASSLMFTVCIHMRECNECPETLDIKFRHHIYIHWGSDTTVEIRFYSWCHDGVSAHRLPLTRHVLVSTSGLSIYIALWYAAICRYSSVSIGNIAGWVGFPPSVPAIRVEKGILHENHFLLFLS